MRWLLTYFSGPIFGFILYIFENNGLSIKNKDPAPLLFALIGYVIGQHIIQALEDIKIKRFQSGIMTKVDTKAVEICDYMLRLFRVSHVPDSEVINAIAASLSKAYHVKNTYVGISKLTGVHTHRAQGLAHNYEMFLSKDKGTEWEDVVGVAELLDGRYEEIGMDKGAELKGTHNVYMITTQTPVLNFILLGPKDAEFNEVYFGWVTNMSNIVDVFYSQDRGLILMFNNYFEALKRAKVQHVSFSYKEKPGDRFVRSVAHTLSGTWVSVGIMGGRFEAANQKEPTSYEVITIKYEEEWCIEGKTYSYPAHKLLARFESETCTVKDGILYYAWINNDLVTSAKSTMVGCYTIIEGDNSLSGYGARTDTRIMGLVRARKIEAAKIKDVDAIAEIVREMIKT